MAKFFGLVGYVSQVESVPGVWSTVDDPRLMKGDIIRQSSNNQNDDKVNSDVSFNHRISLLGDTYAFNNYFNIKWIEVAGKKLEVSGIEIQRPRIIVTLGGLYNG